MPWHERGRLTLPRTIGGPELSIHVNNTPNPEPFIVITLSNNVACTVASYVGCTDTRLVYVRDVVHSDGVQSASFHAGPL